MALFQQPFMSGGFPSMNRAPSSAGPFSDDTGLKAYWKFNEASGTVSNLSESAADLGTAADITVTGATYGATGKIGDALSFDGVNDYCVIGSSTSQFNFLHNDSHEFTIAFWAQIHDWSTKMIFSTSKELASSSTGLGIRAETGGAMRYHFSNGTNMNRFSSTISGFNTDGAWHFYVITAKKNSAPDLEMWEDGVSMGTADDSASTFSNSDATEAGYLGVAGSSLAQDFDGLIDEMSIWSRRLTDDEIGELYNSGTGLEIY